MEKTAEKVRDLEEYIQRLEEQNRSLRNQNGESDDVEGPPKSQDKKVDSNDAVSDDNKSILSLSSLEDDKEDEWLYVSPTKPPTPEQKKISAGDWLRMDLDLSGPPISIEDIARDLSFSSLTVSPIPPAFRRSGSDVRSGSPVLEELERPLSASTPLERSKNGKQRFEIHAEEEKREEDELKEFKEFEARAKLEELAEAEAFLEEEEEEEEEKEGSNESTKPLNGTFVITPATKSAAWKQLPQPAVIVRPQIRNPSSKGRQSLALPGRKERNTHIVNAAPPPKTRGRQQTFGWTGRKELEIVSQAPKKAETRRGRGQVSGLPRPTAGRRIGGGPARAVKSSADANWKEGCF